MKYALVRGIPDSFDRCIKPEDDPQPIDVAVAKRQHRAYCDTLSRLGWVVITLPPDDALPDCSFVEDTAVVVGNRALITHPGAVSRRGEVEMTREVLHHFLELERMWPPATLEGGDVLQIGDKIYVGRTDRTNDAGIAFLTAWAEPERQVIPVDMAGALHLKSIVNAPDEGLVVISGEGVSPDAFADYEVLRVTGEEARRLSFLPLGDTVILPADCPETRKRFEEKGFKTIAIDISEIRKAQAGLTCMSVLFET